ncbi:unnamed protein product [Rhizoctonia solani]|nr:unnamed protein product [Rhizoctonia solani]
MKTPTAMLNDKDRFAYLLQALEHRIAQQEEQIEKYFDLIGERPESIERRQSFKTRKNDELVRNIAEGTVVPPTSKRR